MAALGSCSDKITREHYISKTVIEAVAGNRNQVMTRGFPFLQDEEKLLSESAMTSKMLCGKHNNDLSPLDETAGRLIRLLQNYHSNALSGSSEKHIEVICGENLERWALKTLCGFLASGSLTDEADVSYTASVPLFWLEILGSRVKWPPHWGIYLHSQHGQDNYAHQAFAFQGWFNAAGDVMGARFWLHGIPFYLALHTPENPERFGSHLPGRIIFRKAGIDQIVEFSWLRHTTLESHIFEHQKDGIGLPPLGRIDSPGERMSRQAEKLLQERDEKINKSQ